MNATRRFRTAYALIPLLTAIFCAGAPSRARADEQAAGADQLFDAALACVDKGDWACACPKFQASMDLDPSVVTLLHIAECHERDGRLALAYADVQSALKLNATKAYKDESVRPRLEAEARKVLAKVEPRVPMLRVSVAAQPTGLEVRRDGKPLPLSTLGEALPVDPGTHEVVVTAPGYVPARVTIALPEGKKDGEVRITLEKAATPGSAEPSQPAPASRIDMGRRTSGIVIGSLGVAAIGAAGVLGILTLNKVGDAKPYCAPDFSSCFDQRGIDTLDGARTLQTAGFVALGVGAAALGAGVALFATAPRAKNGEAPKPAISATAGPLGVTLRGVW